MDRSDAQQTLKRRAAQVKHIVGAESACLFLGILPGVVARVNLDVGLVRTVAHHLHHVRAQQFKRNGHTGCIALDVRVSVSGQQRIGEKRFTEHQRAGVLIRLHIQQVRQRVVRFNHLAFRSLA